MDFLAEIGKSELVSKAFTAAFGTTPAIKNQNFASKHTHQENLQRMNGVGSLTKGGGLGMAGERLRDMLGQRQEGERLLD